MAGVMVYGNMHDDTQSHECYDRKHEDGMVFGWNDVFVLYPLYYLIN